jgi:dienelactone hydrolase
MRKAFVLSALLLSACGSTAGSESAAPPDSGGTPTPDAGIASGDDAGNTGTNDASTVPGPSRCSASAAQVECTHQTLAIQAKLVERKVHYELPLGTPPAGGWPTVIYYQGSLVSAEEAFSAKVDATFSAYHLSLAVKSLLDAGFAILAPEALGGGNIAWETNIPPTKTLWEGSSDDLFVKNIFTAIAEGKFGALDSTRLYATGISSGGYMTSRMAVSYAGKFRSLVINSGSYATCSTLCDIPEQLPGDHPPTLFLGGVDDKLVPLDTMTAYRDKLIAQGRVASLVAHPGAGHEWIPEASTAIRDWFLQHP